MIEIINSCDLIEKMQNAFAFHKIVLDDNGEPIDYEYVYVNTAFEELTGLKRNSTIGKKVTELIPGIENSSFNWIKYYGNIAINETEDEIIQYFDIWQRWYKIHTYSPEKNYFVTVFSDITDIKRIEEKANEQSRFLNTILNNIDEIVYVQDVESGKYLYINPIVVNMYGIDPEELYKNPDKWYDIVEEDKEYIKSKFNIKNKLKEIKENGVFKSEIKLKFDHTEKWIKVKALPIINEKNEIKRIIGIEHDITEEKKLHFELEKMALYDVLTEIYNRRAYYIKVNELIERIKREGGQLSIVITDIDKFKNVNDTYGHDVGDIVLKDFASKLQTNIRGYDFVARLGGEEFIIAINTDIENSFMRIEEIRKIIEQSTVIVGENKIKYTASFGISQLKDEDNFDIEKVMKRADEALYNSKNNGRNMVSIKLL